MLEGDILVDNPVNKVGAPALCVQRLLVLEICRNTLLTRVSRLLTGLSFWVPVVLLTKVVISTASRSYASCLLETAFRMAVLAEEVSYF